MGRRDVEAPSGAFSRLATGNLGWRSTHPGTRSRVSPRVLPQAVTPSGGRCGVKSAAGGRALDKPACRTQDNEDADCNGEMAGHPVVLASAFLMAGHELVQQVTVPHGFKGALKRLKCLDGIEKCAHGPVTMEALPL